MEIETTLDIRYKEKFDENPDKWWVAVDDVLQYLKTNVYEIEIDGITCCVKDVKRMIEEFSSNKSKHKEGE